MGFCFATTIFEISLLCENSINHSTDQPKNQPTNQPTNQIKKLINQWTVVNCWEIVVEVVVNCFYCNITRGILLFFFSHTLSPVGAWHSSTRRRASTLLRPDHVVVEVQQERMSRVGFPFCKLSCCFLSYCFFNTLASDMLSFTMCDAIKGGYINVSLHFPITYVLIFVCFL